MLVRFPPSRRFFIGRLDAIFCAIAPSHPTVQH
jgi:hypothetical protein